MKERMKLLKETLGDTRTLTNKEYYMAGTIALLAGIIIGFLFSPVKKGIAVGNNNGHITNSMNQPKKQNKKKEDK